jgi:hypothetical protein
MIRSRAVATVKRTRASSQAASALARVGEPTRCSVTQSKKAKAE